VCELGSGPAVLLVHGFLATHHAFDDVLEPLARDFHVVALDLPGFGASEKPSPSRYAYGLETFAEVVADVVAALQIGRSHLIGHALGGAVALTLAAEHPELVDHMVLVSPQVFASPLPTMLRAALAPLVGGVFFKQLLGRSMFRHHFLRSTYAPGHAVPIERVDGYFDAFNSPAARESAHAVLRATLDTRACVARLSRVRSRSLVVWGRADTVLPPPDAPRLVRQLCAASLELIDAGHCPHEEAPERFVRSVRRFLLGREP
jgi:pimeloyl-ACP methyl ester carboxylesterase